MRRTALCFASLCLASLCSASLAPAQEAPPVKAPATAAGKGAATPAHETAMQASQANAFELKGGELVVSFTTGGADGKAHLGYHDAAGTLAFAGTQIRTAQTELGTLVTVSVRRTVDSGGATFSLLIPAVNLTAPEAVQPVSIVGLTTTHRFSPIPRFNRGQMQTSTPLVLTGTAKHVSY